VCRQVNQGVFEIRLVRRIFDLRDRKQQQAGENCIMIHFARYY
jgi:hypothetical protein